MCFMNFKIELNIEEYSKFSIFFGRIYGNFFYENYKNFWNIPFEAKLIEE